MQTSKKALAFLFVAFISAHTNADESPQKIGLFFNSGAQPKEDSSKNDQMLQESVQAILKLQKDGYDTQGNVFVRDGNALASAPNVQNQMANPQNFLDRVKAVCKSSHKGDDIAISFSGHGLKDDGNADSLQNKFYTYQKEQTQPGVELSADEQKRSASLEIKMKQVLAAQIQLQNLMSNASPRAQQPSTEEMQQDEDQYDQSIKGLAAQLGIPLNKVGELFNQAFANVDTKSPSFDSNASAADISRFFVYSLKQDPSLSGRELAKLYFKLTPYMSMNEIKDAIQNCTKNGARVRMTATNCYSGGLLALTDDKGLVCAATQTSPNSVSGNFGMWNQAGKMDSLSDMQQAEQQRERKNMLDFNSDDGVSSTDYVVNQWVQDLNSSCNKKTQFSCIDQNSRQKLCSAFSGSIPNYYKAGVMGLDSRSIPQDILQLAGTPAPPKQQVSPVDPYASSPGAQAAVNKLRSQEKAAFKLMKDAGFNLEADFNSRADVDVVVKKFIDYLESHPDLAKKLRNVVGSEFEYGDVFKAVITKSGNIPANQKARLTNVLGMWAITSKSNLEAEAMQKSASDIVYRKVVYQKVFDLYAKGSCLKQRDSAKACVDSSFSGTSTPSAPSDQKQDRQNLGTH